jgi:outer membrane lipoprotein-sorting protein
MIRYFFTISIFTLSSLVFSQDAAEILNKLSSKYKTLNSIQAEVNLRTINNDSDIDETNRISIYKKGKKYKFSLDELITVISDANSVWTISPDDEEVTIDIYEEDSEDGEINMSNVFTLYENGFEQYYMKLLKKNDGTYHVIDLIPEDKEQDYFKIRVLVDSEQYLLNEMKVFYNDGTNAIYQIEKFKTDATLEDAIFQVTKADYPGYHFEDLR